MSKTALAVIITVAALLTTFGASVRVLSKLTPITGTLDEIIDWDIKVTGPCVTMDGNRPYFTIDYEQVISMKTIVIIAPNRVPEYENLR